MKKTGSKIVIDENIYVEIVKNKDLSRKEMNLMNNARMKEWNAEGKRYFSRDYEAETRWFFVKRGKSQKIVSFGGIRPIKIKYLGKEYKIGGICSTVSIEKGKGYGGVMIGAMINYSKKTGKTILGFTTQTPFFKKAGLMTRKGFIKRFVYVDKFGKKTFDDEGDGVYYEGKDKFISRVMKTKNPVYITVLHW